MKILLLEDDPVLNEIIHEFLVSFNYEVTSIFDGEEAQQLIYEELFDLLLLDVNVPNLNGFDLLDDLRYHNIHTPTIFITSRDTLEDTKKGFKVGCDDYIKKPFNLSELQLRIENIIRLCQIKNYNTQMITLDVHYNYNTKTILSQDKAFHLSKMESKVFEYLIKNKNRVVSIEEISVNNWEYDEIPFETTIRT